MNSRPPQVSTDWPTPLRTLVVPDPCACAALFGHEAFHSQQQLERALTAQAVQLGHQLYQDPTMGLDLAPPEFSPHGKDALQQQLRSYPWPEVGAWIDEQWVDSGSASPCGTLALKTRSGWLVRLPTVPHPCERLFSWDRVNGLGEKQMDQLTRRLADGRSVNISGLGLFSVVTVDAAPRLHFTPAESLLRALNGETSNDPIGQHLRPGHSLLVPQLGFLHTRPCATPHQAGGHLIRWELQFQPLQQFIARIEQFTETPTTNPAPPEPRMPWWRRLLG